MESTTLIRLVAGGLAVLLVFVLISRRRKHLDE